MNYRVTHQDGIGLFCHPARVECSQSSVPAAAGASKSRSTQPSYQPEWSPCPVTTPSHRSGVELLGVGLIVKSEFKRELTLRNVQSCKGK